MNRTMTFFFLGCVPLRLLLVYLAYKLPVQKLKIMGYLMVLVAIGFAFSYMNFKENDKGAFGSLVWWNNYRAIHAILYLIFSLMVIGNIHINKAYLVLLIDVIIGIGVFSNKYIL